MINIDDCASSPCSQSGGTCHDGISAFYCDCFPGYVGEFCVDFDECSSFPCLNGGVCNQAIDYYFCECLDGFSGPHTNCAAAVSNCPRST